MRDGNTGPQPLVVPKSRMAPKVFASPKKKIDLPPAPAAGSELGRKDSMRSRLRKALAPYLTASYWQGEVTRQFTQEYIEAHPPPENEGDLPTYIQAHLRELNRVTERWGGCVARSLDPLSHNMAVDGRLQRQRDREEGRIPEEERPGGILNLDGLEASEPHGEGDPSYEYFPLHPGSPGAEPGEERLTSDQLEGAVDLVSDIKVWKEILAAKEAEERRQHAIAELHLHHAARIIQRSWRAFIQRRRDEKARLDALVSPDVQTMLSAAAYKAMRDARNKVALAKLRRSLSRRAKGFGSTMPRDIVPELRSGPSRKVRTQPRPPAPASALSTVSASTAGLGTTSYGSRITRVSGDGTEGGLSGLSSRATTADGYVAAHGDGADGDAAAPPADDPLARAHSGLARVKSLAARSVAVSFRDAAEAAQGEEEEEGGEEGPEAAEPSVDGGGDAAATEEGEEDAEGEEEEELDDDGAEDGDAYVEEESAADALAEAEMVVEVAAELAEEILGAVDEDEDAGAEAEAADADAARGDAEAGRALEDQVSMTGLVAEAPLKGPQPPSRAASAWRRDVSLSDDAVMAEIVAGALAAAAAPVLGRSGALAVAQLGLGTQLEGRAKPRSAAARLRPTSLSSGEGSHPHWSSPQEIRTAAAADAGLASPAAAEASPPHSPAVQLLTSPPASESAELALPSLERPASGRPPPLRISILGNSTSVGGESSLSPLPHPETAWSPAGLHSSQPGESPAGGSPAVHERRSSSCLPALPTVLPPAAVRSTTSVDGSPPHEHPDSGPPAAVSPATARRSLAPGSPVGSPQVSPDGHAAAAAQAWALPRQRAGHYLQQLHSPPPPGAMSLSGSLPDPRGHGGQGGASASPRDPTWLLPPISPGGGRGPLGATFNAHATITAVLRASSDPNLQRPHSMSAAAAATAAGGSSGGGGGGAGHRVGIGALAAATAANAGRIRRSSLLGGSPEGPAVLSAMHLGPPGHGAHAAGGGSPGGGGGDRSPVRKAGRSSAVSPGRVVIHVDVKAGAGQVGLLINGVQGGGAAQMARGRNSSVSLSMAGMVGGANEPSSPGGGYTAAGGAGSPTPGRPRQHGTLRTGLSPSVHSPAAY